MKILRWVRKIPIVGNLLWIANAYAYGGDSRSRNELAPLWLWIKAFFWNVAFSIFIASLTLQDFVTGVYRHFTCELPIPSTLLVENFSPGATITSIFPNLLGLGIGIYALLYALDSSVVQVMHAKLEKSRRDGLRKHGSVLMLNSDMAFPLCALLIIIAVGQVAQLLPKSVWLQFTSWVAFWYGIILIFELIVLLFVLIDNSLLSKIEEPTHLPRGANDEQAPPNA